MLQNILLFLFSLSGCYTINTCVADCLLPGMWSGDVVMQNNYLDINTTLHIQLFEDSDSKISGWLYHTDGKYQIQQEYSILHCQEIYVAGDLQWAEGGEIFVKCLSEDGGTSCVDLLGNSWGAELEFSNFYGSYTFVLDSYEEVGDSAKDEFKCIY